MTRAHDTPQLYREDTLIRIEAPEADITAHIERLKRLERQVEDAQNDDSDPDCE